MQNRPLFWICLLFTVKYSSSQTHELPLQIPLNGGQLAELHTEYVDLIKERVIKIISNNFWQKYFVDSISSFFYFIKNKFLFYFFIKII